MKVYVVIGSWEYEGYHDDKMKIFTDKLDAEVYKLELEKDGINQRTPSKWGGLGINQSTPFYDYVDVIEKTLN